MTTIIFLLILAILIFVHELGHFIFAKWCGVRIDAFAIGFGPNIFKKTIGEVTYSLNLIPFGGYVKIFGESPDDESINGADKARSFVHQNKVRQIAILFAGILFNFIFAWILAFFAYSFGVPASVANNEKYNNMLSDKHILITTINDNTPAYKAGLRTGDTLIIDSIQSLQDTVNNSLGKEITINYKRGNQIGSVKVIPEDNVIAYRPAIGIAMDEVATLKLPVHLAFIESFKFTIDKISETFYGIYNLIAGMFKGQSQLGTVMGPVGIAGLIGDAAKIGFINLIMFTALISINLGALNLIPFPALDGGRILFVIIEFIIRKPIKPSVANTLNAIGFSLLMLLIVIVTYKDIARLFVK